MLHLCSRCCLKVHGVPAPSSKGSCLPYRYAYTCQAERKVTLPSVFEQSLRRNPSLKPSEVARQSIIEGQKADVVNWDELQKTTDSLLHTKKISNMKAKITNESNPAGHSFEAVANLKKSQKRQMSFMSTR